MDEPDENLLPTTQSRAPNIEVFDGMFVGDYRIDGMIGSGGMGVVYAATHPLIGKRAAVKVLRKECCADWATVERFIDEARVVNTIGHPNIVDIFAIGTLADGRSYLVMELLHGETLRARIARETFTVQQTIDLVRPLARALDAAHEAGVVHRDLKPDNVFLVEVRNELPMVKLLDFGIAKLANTAHRAIQTASGAVIGTPQYLSPEQAKCAPIDRRADIYALGGIMFEMLVGHPPFSGQSALEIISKHLMEMPARVSQFLPHIPQELDELIFAMLAKEPYARPQLAVVQNVLGRITGLARGSQREVVPTARFGSGTTPPPPIVDETPASSRPTMIAPTPHHGMATVRQHTPAVFTPPSTTPAPMHAIALHVPVPVAPQPLSLIAPPPSLMRASASSTHVTRGRSRALWFVIPLLIAAGVAAALMLRPNESSEPAIEEEPPAKVQMETTVDPPAETPTPKQESRTVEKEPPKQAPKTAPKKPKKPRVEHSTINDDGLIEPGRLQPK